MAKENIEKYKKAVFADQELKKKLNEALAACKPEEYAEKLSALAQEAGFDFTSEEFRENQMQIQEVSDEELDAVSGGRNWLKEGCSATVEPGSWCWTDDACFIWDTVYTNKPTCYCSKCGGVMYEYFPEMFRCIDCGHESFSI